MTEQVTIAQGVIRREEVPFLSQYGTAYVLYDEQDDNYSYAINSDTYRFSEYVGLRAEVSGPASDVGRELALAGLLNVVPRYLPCYGMAPEWGRAVRPLVLIYTAIAFAITIIFNASVDAQGGAYATGVLMIMTSAAFAVMLSALWNDNSLRATLAFGLVTLIFLYTLVANIFERPDGIKIASFFIAAIVVVSLASRVWRSLELRQERIELDEKAKRFVEQASKGDEIHIIAHRRRFADDPEEYASKLHEQREYHHIPEDVPVLFLEIDVEDPSEFEEEVLEVRGVNVGGYRVLRGQSTVVPNAIAAFLLYLRDTTGKTPNCYLGWTEGNPFAYVIRYILFGEGDTAPVTHEVLREAEPGAKTHHPRRRQVRIW